MRRSWDIARKDLRLLLRDKAALFWAFGFPILFAGLFGSAFSGAGGKIRNIPITVIDSDGSKLSGAFVEHLSKSDLLRVTSATEAGALQMVRQGRLSALVRVRNGFGASLGGLLSNERATSAPVLELTADPARRMESGVLQGVLMKARIQALQNMLSDDDMRYDLTAKAGQQLEKSKGAMPPDLAKSLEDVVTLAQRYTTGPLALAAWRAAAPQMGTGNLSQAFEIHESAVDTKNAAQWTSYFQVAFPQAILWGILGCVSSFAIMLVQERSRGTLHRLRVSGVSEIEVLAGKGIACFLTAMLMVTTLAILGRLVFGLIPSSVPLLALGAGCLAASFVGVMLFASTLGDTERAVAGAGWALFLVMGMFGGSMVPLVMMPSWMQAVSHASPVKWGILALEGAYWRKFSLSDMLVPCAMLMCFGVLFLVAAVIVNRRKSN